MSTRKIKELQGSSGNFLTAAAAAEAYAAWNGGRDLPVTAPSRFSSILRRTKRKLGIDPSSETLSHKAQLSNALRLFAISAQAVETLNDPAGVVRETNIYSTFRNFLEMTWFNAQLMTEHAGIPISSVQFAGIPINIIPYRLSGELALNNMILSGLKVMDPNLPHISGRVARMIGSLWRNMDHLRIYGAKIENSQWMHIRSRRSDFRATRWFASHLMDDDLSSSFFHGAVFGKGTTLENVNFDHSNMTRVKFITMPDDVGPPPAQDGLPETKSISSGYLPPRMGVQFMMAAADEEPYHAEEPPSLDVQLATADTDDAVQAADVEVIQFDQLDDNDETAGVEILDEDDPPRIGGPDVDISFMEAPTVLRMAALRAAVSHETEPPEIGIEEAAEDPTVPVEMDALMEQVAREAQLDELEEETVPEYRMKVTRIINSSFMHAMMNQTIFFSSYLERLNFQNTELKNAVFDYATLVDVDFRDADLTDASFKNTTFRGEITFSSNTKITVEQLMEAKDAEAVVTAWKEAFGGSDQDGTNPPTPLSGQDSAEGTSAQTIKTPAPPQDTASYYPAPSYRFDMTPTLPLQPLAAAPAIPLFMISSAAMTAYPAI